MVKPATASRSNAALRVAAVVWIAAGLGLVARYGVEIVALYGHPKRELLGGAIAGDLMECGWGLLAASGGAGVLARRAGGSAVLVVVSVTGVIYGTALVLFGGIEDVSAVYLAVTGGLWLLSVVTLKAIRAARAGC